MTNLQQRLTTAGVAIPVLLVFFWLGNIWFLLVVELVILAGMIEFANMMQAKGVPAMRVMGTIGALLMGAAGFFRRPDLILLTLVVFSAATFSAQLFRKSLKTAITSSASTVLGMVYVGVLFSHIVLLRNWQGHAGRVDLGLFFIVLVVAVTFLNDAGAFFIGRKWGRHKMTPVISPKKSWEGVAGAVLFGVGGAAACKAVFDRWIIASGLGWGHCLVLGALLVGAAIFGDLVESLMKRDAGIKDAGAIVPGHGGILDRLDSIVFTVPLCYYYLKYIVFPGG